MIELIFIIILICSLFGIAVILLRKVPVLAELPEIPVRFPKVKEVKEKIRNFLGIRDFSYELYLQKILSRIRVLTLKTDSKTSGWLERLRQKNNQKNNSNNDNYWEELKKAKNGK